MKKIIILMFVACFFISCDSSLKYVKAADKMATQGNYSDAADNYYTALLTNPSNAKAKQGLQKNAQLVLDAKFSSFAKLVVEGSNEEALRQYNYCNDYFQNVKNVGIELNWPTMYNQLYTETKQEFISKQYDIGLGLMKENKFDKAEFAFNKILEFDSSYKNVSVLRVQTIIEPLYEQGLKYIEAQNYKAAYKSFGQVAQFDASYKSTLQLIDISLKQASLPIAVVLSSKATYDNYQDVSFYQQLVARISKSTNPFLKVIDRNNIDKLLKEQELGMTGIIDAEAASKAGKLIGAKYFLLVDVSQVNFDELVPTTSNEIAYESYSERVYDHATGLTQSVIKFKKVNYKETKQYRKVDARVAYQLVSVQSGQVVSAEVFSSEQADAHAYARFNGNTDNLYPSLPAGNYLPSAPTEWKEKFSELNRPLESKQNLADKAFQDISTKIVNDINLYIEQ
ncbi:MAG: CsgG/HfaB family protein [Bacteroidota bacterium]